MMNRKLTELPIDERIQLVEDLWDSIASDQKMLRLTTEQKAELDRRLNAYEVDKTQADQRWRLSQKFGVICDL